MSLATSAPRQALDPAVVFRRVVQAARTVQDPEVRKALREIHATCGPAITAFTQFGPVCVEAWHRAGDGL